jgi:hypothetical protein
MGNNNINLTVTEINQNLTKRPIDIDSKINSDVNNCKPK